MSEPADAALMQRYSTGELFALRQLFVRHAQQLQAFFLCMGAEPEIAQALSQQTWLGLHEQRKSYDAQQAFVPWLYALAVQLYRRTTRGLPGQHGRPSRPHALPDATSLLSKLRELPQSYREVVVLRRLIGLSFAEIAHVLGATATAVTERARQGEQLLKTSTDALPMDFASARPELVTPLGVAREVTAKSLEHNARALWLVAARDLSVERPPRLFLYAAFLVFWFVLALFWLRILH